MAFQKDVFGPTANRRPAVVSRRPLSSSSACTRACCARSIRSSLFAALGCHPATNTMSSRSSRAGGYAPVPLTEPPAERFVAAQSTRPAPAVRVKPTWGSWLAALPHTLFWVACGIFVLIHTEMIEVVQHDPRVNQVWCVIFALQGCFFTRLNVCERAPRLYRPMLNPSRLDSRMNLLCLTCKQQARICSRMLCRRHCHFPLLFPLCSLRAGTRRRGLSRELSSTHTDSHADELFVLYRARVILMLSRFCLFRMLNFLFFSSSTRSHKFVFYSHPLCFPWQLYQLHRFVLPADS